MNARILIALSLFLFTTVAFSQNPNFHIYLCFGQSNMEGQGEIQKQDKTVDPRFKVLQAMNCPGLNRYKETWYTATPPLCQCWSGLSPSDYFGRTMVANLPDSISVGIINVAVGGCDIRLFDKENYETYTYTYQESWFTDKIKYYEGNPYEYLIKLAKLAQKDGVIKGVLLHQGETNTGNAEWPSYVNVIYKNMLKDLSLKASEVPILAGQVVHEDQQGTCASMNAIINELPNTIPTAHVISSSGCADKSDNVHFNAAGYRKLGTRYAVEMLSVLGYKAVYAEAECSKLGTNYTVKADQEASNGSFVITSEAKTTKEAPINDEEAIQVKFSVSADTTYFVYGLFNNPSAENNSYSIKIDNGKYERIDSLYTNGWQWKELTKCKLKSGKHTLYIISNNSGNSLDKLVIKNSHIVPIEKGEEAAKICVPKF